MNYIGDFAEDSTVRIALTTNNGDGAVVAPSSAFEAADFVIYKNGSATQKATTNGITCTSPFDSVVGLHILEIDTSNDTGDSGFWTAAADYWVVAVPDETVDSQTVVQVIAAFSIQNRYMRGTDGANTTAPDNASITAIKAKTDNLPSDPADASDVAAAFTEIKGTGWSSTTDTLEKIAESAGGGSVTVAPLQATAPNRVAGTELVTYINDTSDIGPIVVTDGNGDAVDLSSYTLKVCIERKENGTIDDNITPTISGAGSNQVTFTPTAACVNSTTPRKWSLRSTSNGQVFAFGDFKVEWPARLS